MPIPRGSLHGNHVPGHPGLQYQGLNNFIRVRVKIPPEIRHLLPGKDGQPSVELTQALGTNDVKVAITRAYGASGVLAKLQGRIDRAMAEVGKPRAVLVYNPLGSFDLAMLHKAVMASQQFGGIDALRIGNASAEPAPASELPLAGYTYEAAVDDYVMEKKVSDTTKDVYRSHLVYFFEQQ